MAIHEDPEKTREINAQAEQLRELVRKRGPACAETKRRAAAILGATLAGGVATPPPAMPAPPPAPAPITRQSGAGKLAALLVAGLVALALVGCVPMEAVQQAREEHALNVGHALDASLPLEARQIGADAARAWSAQHAALDGSTLPMPTLPPELGPVPAGAPR